MIAVASERLEVPHAATAEYEIAPLALADACRVLHDFAPEVRAQQAETELFIPSRAQRQPQLLLFTYGVGHVRGK